MASKDGINGTAVFVGVVGAILVWSAVKDKKISAIVQDLVAGNSPLQSNAGVGSQDLIYSKGVDAGQGVAGFVQGIGVGGDASGTGPGGFRDVPPTRGGLSASQIYQQARAAGFDKMSAITATAIAFAESGGHPTSHNPVPPDNSYGLWQINMLGQMGVDRQRQFGLSSYNDLFIPSVNAHAAYAISGGGRNFTPWTTFTSGAYLQYLPAAKAAAGVG